MTIFQNQRPPPCAGDSPIRAAFEDTVKSHVGSLLVKLEAQNRAHAVALGYQHGLLSLPPTADAA